MIDLLVPDNPARVAPPDDGFDETKFSVAILLGMCDKCGRLLYEGDPVWEFETGLPFGTICYCEDCINDIRRIL